MESNVSKLTTLKVYNPQHDNRHLYASNVNIPRYHFYVGTYIPNPKWVAKDSICFKTDDNPMRIILKKYIEGYDAPKMEKKIDNSKSWKFDGSRGTVYTVTRDSDRFECTCLGFQFRKSCKHINKAKEFR